MAVSTDGENVGGNDEDHFDLYFPPTGKNESQAFQRQGANHGFLDISDGILIGLAKNSQTIFE